MSPLPFVISCILLLTAHQTSSKILLNKCCRKNQEFDVNFNCVESVEKREHLWWVPATNKSKIVHLIDEDAVAYGWYHGEKCEGGQDLLFDEEQFGLNVVDGELFLNVSKIASHHDDKNIVEHQYPSSEFCVELFPDKSFTAHMAYLCPCGQKMCVRKCCSDGYLYNLTSSRNLAMFSKNDCIEANEEDEHLKYWTPQLDKPIQYYRFENQSPSCQRYGHIRVRNGTGDTSTRKRLILQDDGSIQYGDHTYERDKYCGEFTADGEEFLFMCLSEAGENMTLYGVLFVIGSIALFLTVFLGVMLPDMRRNIHGKMTLAHNVMLFIGFVFLGVVSLKGTTNTMSVKECKAMSFVIQFSMLSAFFWLNVMCIDIAWVFSGLRPIRGSASQRDHKKFIYYSLYTWGSTSIIVMAAAILEFSGTDSKFKPRFGMDGGSCFFNSRNAQIAFFYGPMSALLIANFALFFYTAGKIISIKRQTSILQSAESSSNKKNKQRLILYGKLFFLMGVTWIFEVIQFVMDSKSTFFVFTDCINLLRGVFVFMIFCCKKKVYVQASNKLRRLVGMETLETTYSTRETTQNTTSSSISRSHAPMTPVVGRVMFNKQSSDLSIEFDKNKC